MFPQTLNQLRGLGVLLAFPVFIAAFDARAENGPVALDEVDDPQAQGSVAIDNSGPVAPINFYETGVLSNVGWEGVVTNEGGELDHAFSFEGVEDADFQEYYAELDNRFLRPGMTGNASSYLPFQSMRRLASGFRASFETGIGYDSNTLLSNGGYSSPTHPDRGRKGGTVGWTRLNIGYSNGTENDGSKFFYGFDLGGDILSYDSGENRSGRGTFEPTISPYIGIRGSKTTIRLGATYRFSDGNYLYSYDTRREAPVAENQTWGLNFRVTRELDRGTLSYVYDHLSTDFDADTLLNDQESDIHDLSYLYDPPGFAKTSFGFGFRFGTTETASNPEQDFFEPSIRVNYDATAKTSLDGRIGYAFRDYNGPGAIGGDGRMTYAYGVNWMASERTRLRLEAYRDFSPSFVSTGETFDTDGVRLTMNYALPFWLLHFQGNVGYERANYFSTYTAGPDATRKDDYFRYGLSVGRPVKLCRWIDTSVSVFYDYSDNSSNDFQAAFDRHFAGIRLTGSL